MARDVEEQVGENHCAGLAMEKHDLVERRKCPHECLIHFVSPCRRRIVAEDAVNFKSARLLSSPGAQKVCALGYALCQSGTNR
jgi:hypothetical protein